MRAEAWLALETFPGWESIEKLGEGGMCAVYRVRPLDTGSDGPERAVKVLYDRAANAVERFVAEARLLQTIRHPNVVGVHELHGDTKPPWLVMDLLAGRDLEETRNEQGALEPEVVARLYADVASGLEAVHALGIRHRDIKPANIMLGHDGIPRLIDFGIARDPKAARLTGHGLVMGTAAYLPPEVFWSDEPKDAQESEAADVYALGQSLCESATGKPVFDLEKLGGNALVGIMKDKIDRPYLDPREWRPGVPADLAEIIIDATRREVEDRIPTAAELERRLRGFLGQRKGSGVAAPVNRITQMPLVPPPASQAVPVVAPDPHHAIAPHAIGNTGAHAGTAAAASFAGFGLVSAAWVLVLLVGLAGLAMMAPADPAPRARATVNEAVRSQRTLFDKCKRSRIKGEIVLGIQVAGGRATSVRSVRSNISNAEVERCVSQAANSLRFPGRDLELEVMLPVQFR